MQKKKLTPPILKDIKVLDLSNFLARPSVGIFLVELGTDVLNIEKIHTNSDITRQWKNPKENSISVCSASVNGFKKTGFLNFNHPANIEQQTLNIITSIAFEIL